MLQSEFGGIEGPLFAEYTSTFSTPLLTEPE